MKLTLIIIVCHIICLFANHLRSDNYPIRIIKSKMAHKQGHKMVRKPAHSKSIHCKPIHNTHNSVKTKVHGLRSIKC